MSEPGPPAGAESQLRELVPRVLGAVMRRCRDFAAAEDAVQDALLSALAAWKEQGVPLNPGGWLYQAACRALLDDQRSEQARRRRETDIAASQPEAAHRPAAEPDDFSAGDDDTLVLLFTCCHPSLTDASAIALTLRAVGGLTTAEIASAFLVPEATMAQRISRAKQKIRESGGSLALPEPEDRARRLSAVLHVLYLIFNEGHTSTSGPTLVRVELATEAIRLARELARLEPGHPETSGLLALMLLTDARRAARTGPLGELIPLAEQERSRWDGASIAEGTAIITVALARRSAGPYQIQAAIAALHDEAPSTDATDWPQILALYGLLRRIADSPMAAISEAVAAAMVHGPADGLRRLDALAADPLVAGHYRIDAVRAHLCERLGDHAAAVRHYLAAAAGTANLPERNYLLSQAARLQSR